MCLFSIYTTCFHRFYTPPTLTALSISHGSGISVAAHTNSSVWPGLHNTRICHCDTTASSTMLSTNRNIKDFFGLSAKENQVKGVYFWLKFEKVQ